MPTPAIEEILILQDRDARRLSLEAQLKAVPRDVLAIEQKIAAEKAAIDTARAELRDLEAKKKILETEIGSVEDKLARYKHQQMQVRKNDEYQALGQEIATAQTLIGDLEGKELEIMYGIDEGKKKFAAAEAELKRNIAGHEARIRTLREREVSLAEELKEAQASVAVARAPLDEPTLRVYDRITARHQPVCVPIRGGKCVGCHLKVSSEVESLARGRGPEAKLAFCDQCGRIVYWDTV